jgi:hypothetical protein
MADRINWGEIRYFARDNFSEDPEQHAEPGLIYSLDDYRGLLGFPLIPSPTRGALARFRKTESESRHYADNGALSDAQDLFPDGDPGQAVLVALTSQLWGGVGLYLDTTYQSIAWPMLHLDLRPLGHNHSRKTALLWIRRDGEYTYPQYTGQGTRILVEALRVAERMYQG